MAGSTYKIIELVGTSDQSWEDATNTAISTAGESLKDLRVAEVTKLDVTIENGKVFYFASESIDDKGTYYLLNAIIEEKEGL